MLVLSRKATETIVIDDRIHVTILRANRGQVRIGIQAPREVPVVRGELRRDRKGEPPVDCLALDTASQNSV
jgi:carbon storage regulator